MFVGHLATGFVAKKITPNENLGFLMMATQIPDLLFPFFAFMNLEDVYVDPTAVGASPYSFHNFPYSHSLLMTVVWGLILGSVFYWKTKSYKTAFVLFILVPLHWFFDFIVHRPDLPITLWDNYRAGLGLWRYPLPSFIFETGLFFGGGYFYYKSFGAGLAQRKKIWFYIFMIFLQMMYVIDFFKPMPKLTLTSQEIAIPLFYLWIIVLWCYLFDRPEST